MDRPGLRCLVKSRTEAAQRLGRIIFFAGADELEIAPFKRVQAGFDAAIVQAFAGAIAHAAFG